MDDSELVALAGFSPGTARVLARHQTQHWLAALIDTNGDGRLVEFDSFWKDHQGRWQPGSASGAGVYGEGELDEGVTYRYQRQGDRWLITISE